VGRGLSISGIIIKKLHPSQLLREMDEQPLNTQSLYEGVVGLCGMGMSVIDMGQPQYEGSR
jgi:hypothetical protein